MAGLAAVRRSAVIEAAAVLAGPRWLRATVLAVVALYGVLPLVATVLYSIATVWRRKPLPDGYTLEWWASTLSDPAFLGALARSLGIALLTVIAVNLLVLPPLLARTVMRPFFIKMGFIRFFLLVTLLQFMASLPIKMVLRWTFNLKYIVSLPEVFFNI